MDIISRFLRKCQREEDICDLGIREILELFWNYYCKEEKEEKRGTVRIRIREKPLRALRDEALRDGYNKSSGGSLCQGQGHPQRYWRCSCCNSVISANYQDDASAYQCPQCDNVRCERKGIYQEITLMEFCKIANIVSA